MEKIVVIDGKEVGFRATALTPRLYRHKIGRDIVRDLNQLKRSYDKAIAARKINPPGKEAAEEEIKKYEEALKEAQMSVMDLEIFENAAFIMAKQFDPSIPDNPDDWLEGFETFSIYEVLPQILTLWQLNQATTSIPKKK